MHNHLLLATIQIKTTLVPSALVLDTVNTCQRTLFFHSPDSVMPCAWLLMHLCTCTTRLITPWLVLLAGYSSQSQSLLQHIIQLTSAGLPVPASYIFPDANAGNAGLCRLLASQEVMPQEATTTEQIKAQNKPLYAAITDPDATLYNRLGNIANPALIVAGTQDMVLSVEDHCTLVNQIPEASFLQFTDAGHAAILQHAVTAGEVISAFLDAY